MGSCDNAYPGASRCESVWSCTCDLDGDGRAEIVSANGSNNSVTVYRGSSSAPYLTARADYTTAPGGYPTPDDITLADVNGDGSLDIVAVGRAPGQASTFLNNGSGIFGAAISSLIGPYNWDSRASAVADFNGDGLADIVVPIQWDLNAGPFNQVAVLLGDGTGHFEFEQDFAVGFGPYSQPTDVVAGDFNGDGRADFAVSNAGENSVTVMLNIPSVDTTAPVITVPADFTVEATGPSGAEVNWVTYASDNDDQVIIGCTPPWGSVFGLGTTKVECHATDSSGNIGYGSFRVSVVDTTAPIISVPADFTVEATGSSGAVVTYLASATDSVDGTVTTSCSSPSGSLFPFGFKTLVCSAVDAAGNSSSATFTVAVEDRTAPAVTASLVAIKKGGDDSSTQQFRVLFSATDSTGVTWLSTTLNGVAVQNGQIVELKTIKNGQQKVKSESNRLRIEATSFLLIATATDSSGNVGSANAVPVFNKNGKNN